MVEVVKFNNVSKKFGNSVVLEHFDLDIYQNEFVSIVGPSGSGKTTILNIMGMLEDYDDGEVLLFGEKLPNINSHKATTIRRNNINYLFQSFALIEDKTVSTNLMLALKFVKDNVRNKKITIDNVLNMVGLEDKLNATVNTLSGGEKQRVALARTLIKPGSLILADEPTGALDPILADEAFNLIKQLQKEYGKTIVMVTHNLTHANETDRVIDISTKKRPR